MISQSSILIANERAKFGDTSTEKTIIIFDLEARQL